ncbi:MAG: glutathione S-transferase, partial [Steroidobacteraceae bacterium]
ELNMAFAEHLVAFGDAPSWQAYRRISPSGKVPCLLDGSMVVWDSLAIAEYLAERHAAVWPVEAAARAWARSAAAEMHSGFMQLRTSCSMCCGIRVRLREYPPALKRDVERLEQLWSEGLRRFGGPFLGGAHFTAVDAFYAPVAFRIQTYGLMLDDDAAAYAGRLLGLPSMQAWYTDALAERTRDTEHEQETLQAGTVLQDLRRP